ncbi:MAG: ParB N-terminal domain-containing protein, partial [Oscillospiraceae bacterium]|nr:ParB N-terminal domain-containing protein [Oscillospiraceae bacterium]
MNMDMKAMLNNIAATTSNMDIKMLDIDELHDSAENFFHVDRVEELAESILATGRVKENLIVTPIKDGDGYEIVSGHRRTAAVRLLLEKDEKSISRKLPCMVLNYRDDEDKLIDLIMMNVTQRQMSDADLYTSYKKLNEIFQAKKEKGEKFGKFREKIAEILNVSASQVSKLQNIEKHAVPELKKAVENGEVSISTANEIARLDAEEQKSIAKSEELSDISTKEVKEKLPKSEKVATSGNLADDGNKKVATSGNLADDGNKKVATSGN